MSNKPAVVELIDNLNRRLGNAVRWLALAMVLTTMAIVVLRYIFSTSAILLQELVMYMHGCLFLIGLAYGVQNNTHVRVDMVFSTLAKDRQRWVNLAGHLLFLLPVSIFIFVTSLPYVSASWRVLEGSAEVGGIPAVFLLKTLIPVAAVLLFLQGISEIIKIFTQSSSAGPSGDKSLSDTSSRDNHPSDNNAANAKPEKSVSNAAIVQPEEH